MEENLKLLRNTIAEINLLDQHVMREIQIHLDKLTKPQGSLGILEQIALQLGGITGELFPEVTKKAVVVMAADHGVVAEGVSAFPAEVTPQMVLNFVNGGAAINVLAKHAGAEVLVVDLGVAAEIHESKVLSRKIRFGTANMAQEPAMTREEAIGALEVGIILAKELKNSGYQILATGEMGIGNTTASSAITASLLGLSVTAVTGKGTGLEAEKVAHKARIIEKALTVNQPNVNDPLDVLHKVGGLEIAGLAGLIIGAAAARIPILIDGFISTAAALVAIKLAPASREYLIASHCSAELAHRILLQALNLKPILELEMRLGEGTGAALAFQIVEASTKILHEMATFEAAGVAKKIF